MYNLCLLSKYTRSVILLQLPYLRTSKCGALPLGNYAALSKSVYITLNFLVLEEREDTAQLFISLH